MLPVRVVLNRVYAFLAAGRDAEQREKLDADLYAPPGGWDAAEDALMSAIDRAAGGE